MVPPKSHTCPPCCTTPGRHSGLGRSEEGLGSHDLRPTFNTNASALLSALISSLYLTDTVVLCNRVVELYPRWASSALYVAPPAYNNPWSVEMSTPSARSGSSPVVLLNGEVPPPIVWWLWVHSRQQQGDLVGWAGLVHPGQMRLCLFHSVL